MKFPLFAAARIADDGPDEFYCSSACGLSLFLRGLPREGHAISESFRPRTVGNHFS